MRGLALLLASSCLFACHKAEDSEKQVFEARSTTGSAGVAPLRAKREQVTPPFDLKNPPPDAVKTPSGLIYKKIVVKDDAPAPKRNDTVMINYTGWRQSTGETFFTNKSRGKPMPLNLTTTSPGFTEAMQLLHKGERAMLWLPASIGYKAPPQGTPETLVYDVEIVDIHSAPAIPADVAKPPDNAETTKGGVKYVVVTPGTGKDKAKSYDNVTFTYTGWEANGRMFDTQEMMNKQPAKAAPYRQAEPFQEVLTNMTAGERVRFWVDAAKMQGGKEVPGMPTGQLCYEVTVLTIEPGQEPPKTPPDVAKPPADAKKTASGVFYKVLKPAAKPGPHPTADDTVRVNYSGWTTDGKMFDSTSTRNQPAEFGLHSVIAGWTDGIPMMQVGDTFRFWIPESLAYKGAPGKPQGMLVFDVELLEIKPGMHGHDGEPPPPPHGMPPGMPPHHP
jgi:peptidylprolyl isomerase